MIRDTLTPLRSKREASRAEQTGTLHKMEAQEGGQPAGSATNPLNDDAAPRAEPCEELELGDERAWVALAPAGVANEDPNRPGCFVITSPYVCSKPTAPATAHGGDMYGCADGHWVLGVAHDGQDLPPTLVRNIAALSAPNRFDSSRLSRPSACFLTSS